MGAFATITMPISGSIPAIAHDVVAMFPGVGDTTVDAIAGTVTFEIHFPGRLSALVDRLHAKRITVGESATISIPVTSLVPEKVVDADEVADRLNEGSEVQDPEFERGHYISNAKLIEGRVEATFVPCTDALHQLYDAMYTLGLVALEAGRPMGVVHEPVR